ncbi:DUF6261 family protein [uncultured Acetobacteroides sp.]|uniref:DUF6261 family protein n=1 Tax=uncultured Acetobacteroides sp. TaxID=1760811 RepID=UPI0029F494DB|nr:DUF6261 family protein [uncultured Acetobacteroides sp.]
MSRLHVDEQIGLLRQMIAVLKSFDVKTLELEAELSELERRTNRFESTSTVITEKEKTEEMVKLDGELDGYVGSFKGLVKSYSRNPKDEIRVPALAIVRAVEEQGWDIEEMSYDAEVTTISKIDALFTSKPELVSALAKLGVKTFWDDVMATRAKFLAVQNARTQAYGTKDPESPVQTGRQARDQYLKLANRINAFAQISSKPEYNQIISQLNPLIEAKVKLIDSRETRSKNEKEKEKDKPKDKPTGNQ